MPNEYYDHTTYPTQGAAGSSSALRAELDSIEAGFAKLPTLAGNGGEIVVVNAGGTALETTTLVNGVTINAGAAGTDNIAIGAAALDSALAGASDNICIGKDAGTSITTGDGNVVIGNNTCESITTGSANVVIGGEAGFSFIAGEGNTVVGYTAGRNSVSGTGHVSIGYGSNSGTTGSYNTVVGMNAGAVPFVGSMTTGSNNMLLGYAVLPSAADVSNEITLGNSSITALRCQVTSITSLSDRRDKTDITPLAAGLDTVMALNPVRFTWNMRDGGKVGITDSGFIAQDLQTVDDCWLNLVYAENPEKLEASYGRLIPVLVKAIQELKAEIDTLRAELRG